MESVYGRSDLGNNSSIVQVAVKVNGNLIRECSGELDKGKLHVLYCNARSLRNKMDELKGIVASEAIDIIGVTESWTSAYDLDALIEIKGFNLFRQDRINKKGGGVLIYVREKLICSAVTFNRKPQGIESAWVRLKNDKGRILVIGNIYRPPNNSVEQDTELINLIKEACKEGEIIIMGDFNFPNIDWKFDRVHNGQGAEFLEGIQDCFLYQMVNEATREKAMLDLVFSSCEDKVHNLTVGEHLGESDHNIIRFSIWFQSTEIINNRLIPNFRNANFPKLRAEISEVFKEGLEHLDITQQWDEFKDKLGAAVKKHIRFRQKGVALKKSPMWFSRETKSALKLKQEKYKTFKRTGEDIDYEAYKETRRDFKYICRKQKTNLEGKLARDINNNPKGFFAYARGNKVNTNLGPLADDQGNIIEDDVGMANILNEFFMGVFNRDYNRESLSRVGNGSQDIGECNFSREEIVFHLGHIKPFKAPGPDDIYPKVLVECAEELGDVVLTIFESSYKSGLVPMDWKLANVTPLFKKGSKSEPGNYRPVSLTSVICKIFETIVKNHITSFLEAGNLLSGNQYGFRKGRSCTTNLLQFYDKVTYELDNKNCVDIVYIDFQKAFDKVPHEALLFKLERLGISGKILNWIRDWLIGRSQRVQIKGKYSQWADVSSGVPQGSVLGPLLFIIYINDISLDIRGSISIFADDLKIMWKVNSEEQIQQLQEDLSKISDWAVKWGMSFNISKCQVLHLGNNNSRATYTLQGDNLLVADTVRDLGVLVNEDFKMGQQCTSASNKANRLLGYIKKSVSSRSRDIILPLYKGLVRPHMEYGVQFWSPYLKKDIDLLEKVQHRATKMIQGISGMDYGSRLRTLNMYSLEDRRIRGDLIQVFKFIKQQDVEGFDFVTNNKTRGHNFKLIKSRFNREGRKHYFYNRIIDSWNNLPVNVVNSTGVSDFKRNLDVHWGIIKSF